MPKLRLTAVLAALLLAACAVDDAGGITREQFIRANVALRAVSDSAPRVDTLRARALRKEKVTPAQLQAWLREHERNSALLAETWSEISKRVEAADSSRRPPPVPPTSGPPPSFPPGGPEIPPPAPRPPVPGPGPAPTPQVPGPGPAPSPQVPPPPGGFQAPEPPPRLTTPKPRDSAGVPDSAGAARTP